MIKFLNVACRYPLTLIRTPTLTTPAVTLTTLTPTVRRDWSLEPWPVANLEAQQSRQEEGHQRLVGIGIKIGPFGQQSLLEDIKFILSVNYCICTTEFGSLFHVQVVDDGNDDAAAASSTTPRRKKRQ